MSREINERSSCKFILLFFAAAMIALSGSGWIAQTSSVFAQEEQSHPSTQIQTQTPLSNFNINSLTVEEQTWLREHPVIRVVQDQGWPPVEFADENGNPSGISADYLKLVEKRLGITFKIIRNLSWQESYSRLKRWDIDMTTCVTTTPDREKFWAFTKPYMKIPIVILTRSDVTYISHLKELGGKKIAVVDGYMAGEMIPWDFPDIKLVKVKTVKDGLDLLQREEVFALIDNMLVASYYLAKLKMADIKIAGETPYINAQCMAVRKDWSVFAGIIQKALDSITEAERAEIYSKWVPIRYEYGFNYKFLWQAMAIFAVILAGLFVWNRKLSLEIKRRKEVEKALRNSEQRFRQLFDVASVPLCFLNKEGILLDFNNRFIQTFGYNHDDVPTLQEWWQNAYPDPEYRRYVIDTWKAAVCRAAEENTDIEPFEYRITCKSGEVRTMVVSGAIIGGDLLASFFDITERKIAEAAIRESEQKYRELVENINDVIFSVNMEGVITYISPAVRNVIGYEPSEITGQNSLKFISTQDYTLVKNTLEDVFAGHTHQGEYRMLTKSGDVRWVRFSSVPILKDGVAAGVHGVLTDITERKESEAEREKLREQLDQARKMESIGRLAGGVAHDFNNMLNVILGNVELILEEMSGNSPLCSDLEEVQKAALRSADLTRQLLAFARKQTIAPKVLNLNETLEGMLKMLRRLIGEDIDLLWKPSAEEIYVKMDPSQIDQILANLCVNARDSISDTGKVIIETGNIKFDESFCVEHEGFSPGEYVLLAVSDNGCGMDKPTLDNLFEPFFTTKGLGKGTGLGLATVYGIVKQNNGFINVYSETNSGTTFRIYLPFYKFSDSCPEDGRTAIEPESCGSETILLVEDEPSILSLGVKMLQRMGYNVIPALTPVEAIRIAQNHGEEIHLLITDIVMPEMNGRDLEKSLLPVYPNIKRLFMSGYTADVIAHHGVLNEGVHFIQKPFSMKDLSCKVRKALNE